MNTPLCLFRRRIRVLLLLPRGTMSTKFLSSLWINRPDITVQHPRYTQPPPPPPSSQVQWCDWAQRYQTPLGEWNAWTFSQSLYGTSTLSADWRWKPQWKFPKRDAYIGGISPVLFAGKYYWDSLPAILLHLPQIEWDGPSPLTPGSFEWGIRSQEGV